MTRVTVLSWESDGYAARIWVRADDRRVAVVVMADHVLTRAEIETAVSRALAMAKVPAVRMAAVEALILSGEVLEIPDGTAVEA